MMSVSSSFLPLLLFSMCPSSDQKRITNILRINKVQIVILIIDCILKKLLSGVFSEVFICRSDDSLFASYEITTPL